MNDGGESGAALGKHFHKSAPLSWIAYGYHHPVFGPERVGFRRANDANRQVESVQRFGAIIQKTGYFPVPLGTGDLQSVGEDFATEIARTDDQ